MVVWGKSKDMFIAETKIFTNKGWKYISDLSGKDKVLVRNFLGDAEFIQPFALKKSQYDGEVIKFGNQEWDISVTPDHKMVYNEYLDKKLGTKPSNSTAKDVIPSREVSLYRKFRYLNEGKPYERIEMNNGGVTWFVSLSMEDWYTILAYTMLHSYIDKRKNPHIVFISDNLEPLTNIFDMVGLKWTQNTKHRGAPQISLPNTSNLVSKLMHQVGARERRDMKLPDRLIYGASAGLLRHFVGTVLSLAGKPIAERPGQYLFTTVNKNLRDNLEIMCMLAGYGFSNNGEDRGYRMRIIINPPATRVVTKVEKEHYSGYAYEVDLFDGLIYVTDKKAPVWMSPK